MNVMDRIVIVVVCAAVLFTLAHKIDTTRLHQLVDDIIYYN